MRNSSAGAAQLRRAGVAVAALALVLLGTGLPAPARSVRAGSAITFETPTLVDPVHAYGEPDIAVDPMGRVFASGPLGTGIQRSVWNGSVDGGHSYRVISPLTTPSSLIGIPNDPGGGDTDINFDRSGKQYFSDLFALTCLRVATTTDGGATAQQAVFPGGCAGSPGADRQWYAIYDPPPSLHTTTPYTGPRPLVYMTYNGVVAGTQWKKSTDGLAFTESISGNSPGGGAFSPFGADGYPAIDQVTGRVFQAHGDGNTIKLNIGTPDAAGNLTFLDQTPGDANKLITIAANLKGSPDVLFSVVSIDRGRNLHAAWVVGSAKPEDDQVFVSAASAASGWRNWTPAVQVSSPPSLVNIFPWIVAGGAGRADAVWYGADKSVDPSTQAGQLWNVFMAQVVYPTDANGAITGAPPTVDMQKVTPHPMLKNDICLNGSGCIAVSGNRNLADFFNINIDRGGAAEIVYDDAYNPLIQPAVAAGANGTLDHVGAPIVTVARQASGPGLFGTEVAGPANTPTQKLSKPAGRALYPVIGGTEVSGMDILDTTMHISDTGEIGITSHVVDLANPSGTATTLQSPLLGYVTRWQFADNMYYAEMENSPANSPIFSAGAVQSIDLCSVSACNPTITTYPEGGTPGGVAAAGQVTCPATPSVKTPCTLFIQVHAADVGGPTVQSLLEEIGTYSFAMSEPWSAITNAQAQADNVPLEIDGLCCFNYRASYRPPLPGPSAPAAASPSPQGSPPPLPNTGGRGAAWPVAALLGLLLMGAAIATAGLRTRSRGAR